MILVFAFYEYFHSLSIEQFTVQTCYGSNLVREVFLHYPEVTRILSKVMRSRFIAIIILFAGCQDDPENPLVREYNLRWESNIGEKYYQPQTIPSVEFIALASVDDGYIILSRSFDVFRGVVTKADINGTYITEYKIENEFVQNVISTGRNDFYVISSLQNNSFRIRKFDSNLIVESVADFDLSLPYFRKYFFAADCILRARADDASIEKFDLTGALMWRKPIAEYGFPDLIGPLTAVARDQNEVTLTYLEADALKITHIDSKTGNVIWAREYSLTSDFGGAQFKPNFKWGENGKLYFAGSKTVSSTDYISVVVLKSDGSLDVFKDISVGNGITTDIGPVLPTSDKGSIISLGADVQRDTANFRLLKIDSRANPGWIGTFRNDVGFDFLSGLVERPNGDVIFLTYYGYLTALYPEY
jgi:hypothetical protein